MRLCINLYTYIGKRKSEKEINKNINTNKYIQKKKKKMRRYTGRTIFLLSLLI